jgi:hypothetical protein
MIRFTIMKAPKCFVVVFGDPEPGRDRAESGVYEAGEGYPSFLTEPGDMLLLYCTRGYAAYQVQVPGIGVVLEAKPNAIKYRWLPLDQPIKHQELKDSFEPEYSEKMRHLGIKVHRVFEVSQQSFARAMADRTIAWGEL